MAGKTSTGKSVVARTSRMGEGYAVEVAIIPAAKAGDQAHYSIDMGGLPVPDRRLSCDAVALVRSDFMMKLLFAQQNAVGDGVVSLLVVQMNFEAVENFVRTMVPLEEGIAKLEDKHNFPKGKLSEFKGPVQHSATVNASIVMAGYSGTDGCLDFYYTSPFAIKSINFGNTLSVEPVVRVHVPTPLLVAMSRGLREFSKSFPKVESEVEHA